MGITGWLLVWLIVNALIVVWRALVSPDIETCDRPSEDAGRRSSGSAKVSVLRNQQLE